MQDFRHIGLDEMDGIRLMNRIDTKYVTTEEILAKVLSEAAEMGYRALEINRQILQEYRSLYYDTEDLKMYLAHHDGKRSREKIRIRHYGSTQATYLEIKRKLNTGRTVKSRMPIPYEYFDELLGSLDAVHFLEQKAAYSPFEIFPELTTEFFRLTLVDEAKTERVTIDQRIGFVNYRTGARSDLRNAVIIETKRDGRHSSSLNGILLKYRVHPFKASKYCLGTALTDSQIKKGLLKPKLMRIGKIINHRLI